MTETKAATKPSDSPDVEKSVGAVTPKGRIVSKTAPLQKSSIFQRLSAFQELVKATLPAIDAASDVKELSDVVEQYRETKSALFPGNAVVRAGTIGDTEEITIEINHLSNIIENSYRKRYRVIQSSMENEVLSIAKRIKKLDRSKDDLVGVVRELLAHLELPYTLMPAADAAAQNFGRPVSAFENAPDAQSHFDEARQAIPTVAPMLFRERSDRSVKADAFLKTHYGPWLGGNGLYQNTLRKLDPSLMNALDNQFRGRRNELQEILPTKFSEVDARLEAALGYVPRGTQRLDAINRLQRSVKPKQ